MKSILIYAYRYIKSMFNMTTLKSILAFVLLLAAVHFSCFYFNERPPLGLLYGPLLFLTVAKSIKKGYWLHYLPFAISGVAFSILKFKEQDVNAGPWENYFLLYFISVGISLFVYSCLIWKSNKKNIAKTEGISIGQELVQLLAYGGLISSLLIGLLVLKKKWHATDFGFDLNWMLFFLLGTFMLLIGIYLLCYEDKTAISLTAKKEPQQCFDDTMSASYIETLDKCVRETDLYRNPDISLDMLASQTTIPRHHLTRLLNVYLGKNFYQYIAELRIEYALGCLKNDAGIKIESLAYECGFNSKTSFNRYFKEYTGYLPSYYKTIIHHS